MATLFDYPQDISRTTTNTTANQTSSQFGSKYGTQTTTTQRLTPQQQALLDNLLQQAAQFATQNNMRTEDILNFLTAQMKNNTLTREQAIADTKGFITAAQRDLTEGALKNITAAAAGAGASQDAMAALLQQDAIARRAGEIGRHQADIVAQYVGTGAQANAQLANALVNAMQANQFDPVTALLDIATKANETTRTTNTGVQSSVGHTASEQQSNQTTYSYGPYSAIAAAARR